MTSDLEKAITASRRADQAADTARRRLHEAIRHEAAAGTRQRDIVRLTGFTREYIRRICRGNT